MLRGFALAVVMLLFGAETIPEAAEAALVKSQVVTYVKSSKAEPRSATAITIFNDSATTCSLRVDFFPAFNPDTATCSLSSAVSPGTETDFCTRAIPNGLTECNHTCSPDLGVEGKAVVFTTDSAACKAVRVDARIYYTTGSTSDTGVAAISNPLVHK